MILRPICFAAAWVSYHLVTSYDQACAVHAVFRKNQNGNLESNSQFVYPPIRLNRFWHTTRLLQLAPGIGVEPVEGVLLTNVTIKILSWAWTFGKRHYHAISYCWGESTVTKMIYLNGKLLPVTETLHSALQSLRQRDNSCLVWADQVCIDQSQAAIYERNQQVQRMGDIYANAKSVTIWLGEPTRFSDVVFDHLNDLMQSHIPLVPNDLEGHATESSSQQDTDTMPSRLLEALRGAPGLDQEGQVKELLQSGFENLLNNAWFSRIWVLQEAALARNLFIQAGSRKVLWKHFVVCVRFMQDGWNRTSGNAWPVYDIEMLREQRFSIEPEEGDLLMMVEAFRGRQATDSRDKIYGLLGLTITGSSGRGFQPDYSKSPQQVFLDFTLWHIQAHGNVRALAKCCSEEVQESSAVLLKHSGLPSWATDWSVNSPSDCADLVDDSFLPKPGTPLYNASRGLPADARIIFDDTASASSPSNRTVLVLKGINVDVVAEVVDRMHTLGHESDCFSMTWIEWMRFALEERSPDPYGSRRLRTNAFWRTLLIDRSTMLERAHPAIGEYFGNILSVIEFDEYSRDLISGARNGASNLREQGVDDREQVRRQFTHWLEKWNSAHFGKKIFRTESGYLGISCEHVQKGDKVAILWGGRLPFLLREHGGILLPGKRGRPSLTDDTIVPTYKLIGGECYIHGLADGQGLDIAERVGILPTKICLI